jgi:hypothetical protein
MGATHALRLHTRAHTCATPTHTCAQMHPKRTLQRTPPTSHDHDWHGLCVHAARLMPFPSLVSTCNHQQDDWWCTATPNVAGSSHGSLDVTLSTFGMPDADFMVHTDHFIYTFTYFPRPFVPTSVRYSKSTTTTINHHAQRRCPPLSLVTLPPPPRQCPQPPPTTMPNNNMNKPHHGKRAQTTLIVVWVLIIFYTHFFFPTNQCFYSNFRY